LGKKFKLRIEGDNVSLDEKICFDLYQSIPSDILPEVEDKFNLLLPQPALSDPDDEPRKIIISKDGNLTSCINCADPPCMTYNKDEVFNAVDSLASRVCPDNLIQIDSDGIMQIDESKCTGCMICVNRCPFSAITLVNDVAKISRFTSTAADVKDVNLSEQRKITDELKVKVGDKPSQIYSKEDIKKTLDNFDKKVSKLEQNWDQDPYYVCIRNWLNELGLEAKYTGSPGKLRVADVTIDSPFAVGIEAKSPAESDVDIGAIRQADHARRQTASFLDKNINDVYAAAIGQGVGRGSNNEAQSLHDQEGKIIPIMTGRVLLYIFLKHISDLPMTPQDLEKLFSDFYGEITLEKIKEFFTEYFSAHNMEGQQIETKTMEEIDYCFSTNGRQQRGSYSKS
jgi:Fe-S-cluster-containing hydrogenase component 2